MSRYQRSIKSNEEVAQFRRLDKEEVDKRRQWSTKSLRKVEFLHKEKLCDFVCEIVVILVHRIL